MTKLCIIEGCDKKLHARQMCQRHYLHWWNQERGSLKLCSIDGCEKPVKARGWCSTHWKRWEQHGDPLGFVPYDQRNWHRGQDHPGWKGDQVGYASAHERVYEAKGRAELQVCVDCGEQAKDWSLDYEAPSLRTEVKSGLKYHSDPIAYDARCRSCHRTYDRAWRSS